MDNTTDNTTKILADQMQEEFDAWWNGMITRHPKLLTTLANDSTLIKTLVECAYFKGRSDGVKFVTGDVSTNAE